MSGSIPLIDQIACARREIALRESVYPSWVARQRMTKESADLELERMRAVLQTLEWLQRNETKVRAAVSS
jgi:hypothetical protein